MKPFLIIAMTLIASQGLAEEPLRVQIVAVTKSPLTYDMSLTGALQARDSVNVGFRQGGRIAEVLVKEGDKVEAGQELARTDGMQQRQGLLTAKARLASAQATRDQAQQERDRAAAMLDHGVGTRAAVDNAEQSLSQASGAVSQAEAEVSQAQRAFDDTVMRSPTNAIVTARNAEPGQVVGAAQPVISLAATAGLEAVFQTPDSPGLNNALGAPVTLTGVNSPVPEMKAEVSEISPLVDPHTGSVRVRAQVKNAPTDVALLGAAVRGTVHFPAGTGIALPWTVLTANGDSAALWVVGDDNRVTITDIIIERFTTESVIVRSGVEPGQRVVAAGSQLLFPARLVIDAEANP